MVSTLAHVETCRLACEEQAGLLAEDGQGLPAGQSQTGFRQGLTATTMLAVSAIVQTGRSANTWQCTVIHTRMDPRP